VRSDPRHAGRPQTELIKLLDDQRPPVALSEVAGFLRRRLFVIVLVVVLAAAVAVGLSLRQTKQYTATASLLFSRNDVVQLVTGIAPAQPDPAVQADTEVRLASLDTVAGAAARRLRHGETLQDVRSHVSVAQEGSSDLVSVTANAPQPAQAAALATAVASAFVDQQQRAATASITSAISGLRHQLLGAAPSQRSRIGGEIQRLQLIGSLETGGVQLAQPAQVPSSPSSPTTTRNGIIGGFAGLLLGLALAIVLEGLDRRVRRPEDAESVFELPILTSVRRSKALKGRHASLLALPPGDAEAFQRLHATLRYGPREQIRSVLITSAAPASGKSTVAMQLCRSAALAGDRVLLVEADSRAPSLARLLKASPGPGLASMLERDAPPLEDAVVHVPLVAESDGPSFDALLVNPDERPAPEKLSSDRMRTLLLEAHAAYDFVVVDAPSAAVVSDAIPLFRQLDGVVIVARLRSEKSDEMQRLRRELRRLDVTPIGVVANFSRENSGVTAYVKRHGVATNA